MAAYNAWKIIYHSRSIGVVSEDLAKRYTEIQNYHSSFFGAAERAFLINFVIMSLHPFDKHDESFSLYKINKLDTEKFIIDNESVFEALKKLRNKLFAHRDIDININDLIIPSVVNMDKFFQNLIELYNKLTGQVDKSFTVFDGTNDIKSDIEYLYMNLFRGENIRKNEIDIDLMWDKDDKKISDVL